MNKFRLQSLLNHHYKSKEKIEYELINEYRKLRELVDKVDSLYEKASLYMKHMKMTENEYLDMQYFKMLDIAYHHSMEEVSKYRLLKQQIESLFIKKQQELIEVYKNVEILEKFKKEQDQINKKLEFSSEILHLEELVALRFYHDF